MSSAVPRLRLAFEGDALDPASWSGIPAGLVDAFRGLGVPVDVVDVTPRLHRRRGGRALSAAAHVPPAIRSGHRHQVRPVAAWLANSSAAAARRRSRTYRRAVRDLSPAAGVVRMRGQFTVEGCTPSVVLDDLTLAHAFDLDWRGLSAASPGMRARALRSQQVAYRQAVACCAASSWAARSMVDDLGVSLERVHVVGFGVRGPIRDVVRDWTHPRFLFVGMDWARKNGDAVVRAFAALRREFPAAELDVVGNHPRLDMEGVRLHGVLPRGVPDAQRRLGHLAERSTCLVMPSEIEPFGVVYVEAAAVGVPSIGTTVGGAGDAVGDGGLLVDPRQPRQLLAAMRDLAEPAAARRYGAAALRHAARCTWEIVAQRLARHLIPGRFDDVADLVPVAAGYEGGDVEPGAFGSRW